MAVPPTRLVKPVLFSSDPLENLAIPLAPVVITGDPEILIFPLIEVPILSGLPAFIRMALTLLLEVEIFCAMLKSPVMVSTKMVSVAKRPLFPPTVPIVKPPLPSV